MGQLSDPYEQGEEGEVNISLSGLPEDAFDRADTEEEPGDDSDDGPQDDVPAADESDDESDDESEDVQDEAVESEDVQDEAVTDDDEEVAYDLTEWEDDSLDALFDALEEADVPYLWDGEELFINASDERAVDELLESVTHPHQLQAEDADGDGGGWLLGELFVAADRLQHDPEEHETVARLLQLATTADETAAPYGLGDPEWDSLRERVTALATELEAKEPVLETVIEAAQELRSAIRPYV